MKVSKTFEVELPGGEIFELEACAVQTVDPAYGADADGNRGQRREYLEDVTIPDDEMKRLKERLVKSLTGVDWD